MTESRDSLPQPRKRGAGVLGRVARYALFALCIVLFGHALAQSDLRAAWERIQSLGPRAALILIPFPIGLAFDVIAWQRLLATLGCKVDFRLLYRTRLITEAVTNTTPMGAVWADAVTPSLVSARANVSAIDVLASQMAKRWLLVRTHGLYVATAAALGATAVQRASHALGLGDWLIILVLASALGLLLFAFGMEWLAARAQVVGRLSKRLGRARWLPIASWISKRHASFAAADTQLARLADDKSVAVRTHLRLAVTWVLEGFETYLILRLLGAPLGLVEVMSFDAALSIVRSVAVFAPAGIGVQDVGYLAVLEAYGVPNAAGIGPAFVVLKRAKELLFVAIGFLLFAQSRRRPSTESVQRAQTSEADVKT